ncbi:MAG: V-type ATP synthase subunit D [Kiritimatiellaeota bacterium]|nr:V-type ATP synthase subunit D [Kiritimatiellota bacterium]
MAKIKLTKTELKAQGDALKRFERFLPMLQLKKQQLQVEIAHITARIEEVAAHETTVRDQLNAWVSLFSEGKPPAGIPATPFQKGASEAPPAPFPKGVDAEQTGVCKRGLYDLKSLVRLDRVVTDTSNIAGVAIPVFKSVRTTPAVLDLFETPPWLDAAVATVTRVISLKAERTVLERERELVTIELNMTAQRVNLFEKVKIPECRENIRVIKIALGDMQTASVTRGKIAKGRTRKDEEDAA